MPRETVAFVIFMGLGMGMLWGGCSVFVWQFLPQIFPPWGIPTSVPSQVLTMLVLAPLYLTAAIGERLRVDVYVTAAVVSAALGILTAAALLWFARARGA
ncbi:MAG TPA: hypothetical protein VGR46_00650 [Candidatus Limnocylindria bacterium]|jgi:hypothetical protein|nr:hypothetical protein [Candidatus Limnocylindria bacterium]